MLALSPKGTCTGFSEASFRRLGVRTTVPSRDEPPAVPACTSDTPMPDLNLRTPDLKISYIVRNDLMPDVDQRWNLDKGRAIKWGRSHRIVAGSLPLARAVT